MAAVLDDGLDGRRSDPERLRSLRVELKRRGLDGFIVPRSDEHQGEYVARRSERLAWLTGFSGSAGIAIVLKRKAAVFVDGRYTLQGIAEIDLGLYELHHLVDEPPSDWVGANLPEGAKLGYDPWLMAPAQLLRFQRACKAAGGELVPTNGNPIDAIWTNQPRPPLSPIVVHDARFTGSTSTERRQTVAKSVAAEKLDAVVLTSPDSIAWLLNIRGNDVPYAPLALSFAVLYADATVEFFVDPRKVLPGLDRHFGKAVRIQGPEGLAPTLDRLGQEKKTVRLDHEKTPAWILWRLRKAGANVMRGNDPCQLPKAKKTRVELDGMRRAHVRDGASLTRFLAWIAKDARSGRLTEMAAADKLYEFRKENDNFRGPSFPTISAFGPDGAIVHYRATPKTNRKIKRGSLYLIDSGAQYLDATTDVTRTVAVGKPSAEMRDRFTRVLKGHIALATAKFPRGTTGSQIDVLARRALWEVGLDYDHGTGHGVGSYLGVHEGPQRISKVASTVPLQEGMVISNEPGYYKTGAYGIRVENLVAVVPVTGQGKTDRPLLGLETLTLAPIDTALVDPALLSDGEITWLNAYHKRVREKLRRHVDRATRGWLKRATKPIKAARRRRA
ncbi:MAG: aminopeptidase P family protein [Rhodospirillales bacterium]|nr:aminopeptidase P family protein [Rhodospirillales bacterium]